ncbi:tRNA pseudouridine synthase B [Jatrophihabitans endophyticus]|uniref:tRNA pseudouridine synthase B n=1 Tax=Jatrophihabitans endophyticus TaxID=1206085 RepID=A0A1M5MFI7_9ACTN|nr:tRNA pseudouridine(55) synthase TruB [Jatrophihabitans endophyticus]SHG76174.1 tRNA pseudouridine synthase B [Jatrophihabitans endophyticus]
MAKGQQGPPGRDGIVVVDKPAGWTSHDVVGRLRRLARTRKVGHAGTLDPMATGVLVVGVGAATRLLHHLVLADKAYTATVRLGQATVTDDAEGEVTTTSSAAALTEDGVRVALAPLTGDIAQVPSAVSAIKVDGIRSYRRVRDGEQVELAARPVTVSRLEATGFGRPAPDLLDVAVEVECSSGTYVRALARDLGAALGVGGHLTTLRRTRVGPFALTGARTLDALAELDDPVTLPLPDAIRTALPVREIDADQAREVSFGRALPAAGFTGVHGALTADGTAVALLRETEGRARPVLVFTPAG